MTQAEPMLAPIDRAVAAALPRWGCSPAATARMINHSENVTYRVDDTRDRAHHDPARAPPRLP